MTKGLFGVHSVGMIKLKTSAIITSGVLVTSLASAYLFNGVAYGNWDFDGLNQQVQHLSETADNHEARLTNVENKVDTPTGQPTPTPQVVTKVVTQQVPSAVAPAKAEAPAATVAPTPAPKTVTKVEHMLCNKNDMSHEELKLVLTYYSDGTVYQTFANGESYNGIYCVPKGTW